MDEYGIALPTEGQRISDVGELRTGFACTSVNTFDFSSIVEDTTIFVSFEAQGSWWLYCNN
jgi:hypothetical protein